jgi:DNA polymerase theta
LLAKWLDNAKFYHSKYRPVPVEEHLVFDNSIYPSSNAKMFFENATQLSTRTQGLSQAKADAKPVKIIEQSQSKELSNSLVNSVVALANETARSGYGALVFCSSRLGCERDAVLISQVLPRPNEVDESVMGKRNDLLNDLRSSMTGLDSTLEKTVPVGVAFHREYFVCTELSLLIFLKMLALPRKSVILLPQLLTMAS